jgi:hypothetical protein
MTNRITREFIETRVAEEAKASSLDLDVNYSYHYGGYQITYNNGSSILMHRKNAKETLAFLDGIHAGRYLQSRQLVGEVA